MTPSEKVAIRIKEARLQAGMSQRQLGVKAGIVIDTAKTRVSHYETLVSTPPLETLIQLAVALDKPITYFFCDDDEVELLTRLYKVAEENRSDLFSQLLKLLPELTKSKE